MRKGAVLGIIFLILGVFFLINSFSGITGFVIVEDFGRGISGILGVVFVLVGILLFSAGNYGQEAYRKRESKLREILGEKFEQLSDTLKIAYNKSYRRYLEKMMRSGNDRIERNVKDKLKEIVRKYKSNRYDEVEAADRIVRLGKMERLVYNPDVNKFSVTINGHPYYIPQGLSKKERDELLVELNRLAPKDCIREIHLGRFASTKHHKKGLKKL